MDELHVHPDNRPALAEWDGELGQTWATHIDWFESGLRRYGDAFLAAARITASDHVLDVGCGAGQTTIDAAREAPRGRAVGIDLSGPLLDVARGRAQGLDNVTFVHGDAQVYPFAPAGFDVVISRNGTLFFADRSAAFSNIASGVRPGGRLALLAWAALEENVWLTTINRVVAAGRSLPPPAPGAPSPLSMSDPADVRHLLESSGWGEVGLQHLTEQLYFGPDVDTAWSVLSAGLARAMEGLDDDRRLEVADKMREELAARASEAGVWFPSAMWLVTASRA